VTQFLMDSGTFCKLNSANENILFTNTAMTVILYLNRATISVLLGNTIYSSY